MRGMSIPPPGATYVPVVLLAVPPKSCAVAPTVGYHSARGISAACCSAATRATAARSSGWCARAYVSASSSVKLRSVGSGRATSATVAAGAGACGPAAG